MGTHSLMTPAVELETFRFTPDLGSLEHRLLNLARRISGATDARSLLESIASDAFAHIESQEEANEQEIRWALSLSLLADILAAGGHLTRQDSVLRVSWPDWNTSEGELALRSALIRLRREASKGLPAERIIRLLPSRADAASILETLSKGELALFGANEKHPSGVSYHELFVAARNFWTMPPRDREGRTSKFVLAVTNASLDGPMPIGILEVGDGAPHDPVRDEMLGLTTGRFRAWLAEPGAEARLRSLVGRFDQLRAALIPIPGLSNLSSSELYSRSRELEAKASGRSKGGDSISEQKRLIYLTRVIKGRTALEALSQASEPQAGDLYAAVRLLRDMTVPRVNLELTICGALPPFSTALAGKLVTAFAADPRVLAVCRRPFGQILRNIFLQDKLQPILPNFGAVLLTTKGLYASHSAQYSRAELPSTDPERRVKFRRIGLTLGETASLISRRTYRTAQKLLACTSDVVSDVFGSGGSKRQRRIEAAVRELDLPDSIIHPKIRRPVYAASLVANLLEVVLMNSEPKWLVPQDPQDYTLETACLWRERWLPIARRRLEKTSSLPGLRDFLEEELKDETRRVS